MEQHILSKVVDCILWWSQRRNRFPTLTEALKEFDIAFNKEHLELVCGWWNIAQEVYIDHFKPNTNRKVSTKDDTSIARLMASLIYSEYEGEPGDIKKGKCIKKGIMFPTWT